MTTSIEMMIGDGGDRTQGLSDRHDNGRCDALGRAPLEAAATRPEPVGVEKDDCTRGLPDGDDNGRWSAAKRGSARGRRPAPGAHRRPSHVPRERIAAPARR